MEGAEGHLSLELEELSEWVGQGERPGREDGVAVLEGYTSEDLFQFGAFLRRHDYRREM